MAQGWEMLVEMIVTLHVFTQILETLSVCPTHTQRMFVNPFLYSNLETLSVCPTDTCTHVCESLKLRTSLCFHIVWTLNESNDPFGFVHE